MNGTGGKQPFGVRTWRHLVACAAAAFAPGVGWAQPADLPIPAATSNDFPPGVSVARTDKGRVYVDSRGRTLYGRDLRTLVRWSTDPVSYCEGSCAKEWEPLLAPPGSVPNRVFPRLTPGENNVQARQARAYAEAQGKAAAQAQSDQPNTQAQGSAPTEPQAPASDWTIAAGPQGPQWVYKEWHLVFTRRSDRPGSTEHDGAEDFTWNTLKYVPPVPKLVAPRNVTTALVNGDYALADENGRLLFTGNCTNACADWVPFAAGVAVYGLGDWSVSRSGDAPQWLFRGKPVYVSEQAGPAGVPETATILSP